MRTIKALKGNISQGFGCHSTCVYIETYKNIRMICFYTQMILLPLSYCKLQSCSIPINVWKVSSLSFSWLLSLTVVHVHIAVHHVVHHVVHGMCLSTIPCMCTISCTLQCMTCACAPCTLCTSPLQRRRGSVVYEQGTFSKFNN